MMAQMAKAMTRLTLSQRLKAEVRSMETMLAAPKTYEVSKNNSVVFSPDEMPSSFASEVAPPRFVDSFHHAISQLEEAPVSIGIRARLQLPALDPEAIFKEDSHSLWAHRMVSSRSHRMVAPQFVNLKTADGSEMFAEYIFACSLHYSHRSRYVACVMPMAEVFQRQGQQVISSGLLTPVKLKLFRYNSVRRGRLGTLPEVAFIPVSSILGPAVLLPRGGRKDATEFWSQCFMSDIMAPVPFIDER